VPQTLGPKRAADHRQRRWKLRHRQAGVQFSDAITGAAGKATQRPIRLLEVPPPPGNRICAYTPPCARTEVDPKPCRPLFDELQEPLPAKAPRTEGSRQRGVTDAALHMLLPSYLASPTWWLLHTMRGCLTSSNATVGDEQLAACTSCAAKPWNAW